MQLHYERKKTASFTCVFKSYFHQGMHTSDPVQQNPGKFHHISTQPCNGLQWLLRSRSPEVEFWVCIRFKSIRFEAKRTIRTGGIACVWGPLNCRTCKSFSYGWLETDTFETDVNSEFPPGLSLWFLLYWVQVQSRLVIQGLHVITLQGLGLNNHASITTICHRKYLDRQVTCKGVAHKNWSTSQMCNAYALRSKVADERSKDTREPAVLKQYTRFPLPWKQNKLWSYLRLCDSTHTNPVTRQTAQTKCPHEVGLSTGIQELLNTVQTVGHIHSSGSCRPVLNDGTKKCRVVHVHIIDAEKVKRVLYKDTYTPTALGCSLYTAPQVQNKRQAGWYLRALCWSFLC